MKTATLETSKQTGPISGEPTTMTMPTGRVSVEGQLEIREYLDIAMSLRLGLPLGWDWRAKVGGRGEYVGSLPKRIGKFYHRAGEKLSAQQLSEIGNMAIKHTSTECAYRVDFTQRLNWSAGDFGDGGSCFWSCHRAGRIALENHGGWGVRFYDTNTHHGIGRCWLVTQGNGTHIIFNSYGPYELPEIARLLATQWGQSYRQIDLHNNGEVSGELWVNHNSDGGHGHIIGSESEVSGMAGERVDLRIDVAPMCTCAGCGDSIDEDRSHRENEDDWCEECYNERFCACEHCDEVTLQEDTEKVNGRYGDEYVCKECLEEHYTLCEHCDEYFQDTTTVRSGEEICNDCLSNDYACCDDCADYVPSADITTVGGSADYCEECLAQYTCSECGETTRDIKSFRDNLYCEECQVEVEVEGMPLLPAIA